MQPRQPIPPAVRPSDLTFVGLRGAGACCACKPGFDAGSALSGLGLLVGRCANFWSSGEACAAQADVIS